VNPAKPTLVGVKPKMEKTDSLRVDCILAKPVDFDWSEGYGETWEVVQPYEDDDFSEDWEENEEKLGYPDFYEMEDSNQPMMSYYYPVDYTGSFDPWDWAKKINDLPLCVVRLNDDNQIVLITDIYDSFVVRNSKKIIDKFLLYKCNIVVSTELGFSTQGLEKIRKIDENYFKNLLKKYYCIDHLHEISINAGQIIGYAKDLRKLFKKCIHIEEKIINDDQAALFYLFIDFLEEKTNIEPFYIDFDQKLFGTITGYNDDTDWEYDTERKLYKNKYTKSYPCSLHFCSNWNKYHEFGTKLENKYFYTQGFLKN